MKIVFIIMLLIGYSTSISEHLQRLIDRINEDSRSTWKAKRNYLTERAREDIRILMGVNLRVFRVLPEKQLLSSSAVADGSIPRHFDARDQWPYCSIISTIRNQGRCGSCWAFATAQVMADRRCIKSRGALNSHISTNNLLTCCPNCGFGCNGGYPEEAFLYWIRTGIVSGGDYASNQGCQPYSHLAFFENRTPDCIKQCLPESGKDYQSDLQFGSSAYAVSSNVAAIQREILENGPVVASYKVYDDFITYSSGVYMHRGGGFQGDHAIKIIGWGEENNVPYWECANSWGKEWGNEGFFRILRGFNESGIEQFVVAANV